VASLARLPTCSGLDTLVSGRVRVQGRVRICSSLDLARRANGHATIGGTWLIEPKPSVGSEGSDLVKSRPLVGECWRTLVLVGSSSSLMVSCPPCMPTAMVSCPFALVKFEANCTDCVQGC